MVCYRHSNSVTTRGLNHVEWHFGHTCKSYGVHNKIYKIKHSRRKKDELGKNIHVTIAALDKMKWVQNMGALKWQVFSSFVGSLYPWQCVPTHCAEARTRLWVLILSWKSWTQQKHLFSEFAYQTAIIGEINWIQMLDHGKLGKDTTLKSTR